MTDAYCHLDMDAESPIADIERRITRASVSRALLVETWDGRNRQALVPDDKFAVALCYREECRRELLRSIERDEITGIRMSTEHLRRDQDFCREVAASGKMLVAHAESGVGALCRELTRLQEMKIYVPHLAWPVANGKADGDWDAASKEFASMPFLSIGISAIAHFSSQPFPHDDVRDFAYKLISRFPVSRIKIGSDYPLFEKERYADYINLAHEWVRSIHPKWKTEDSF